MKKIIFKILLIVLSVNLFIPVSIFSQDEARLLRFPAIHGKQIVFSYAGDLYTVSSEGGMARKLTNDVGYEMFARFSPDGKYIAFTAQYDGNTEVYLIPSEGGEPKGLTYTATLSRDDVSDRMGPNNIVMGWKNNDTVVYRSRKTSFNDFKGKLYLVSKNGGVSSELPLPCGGFCSFSKDENNIAYNRIFREFRTWKYYSGGMADDIWIYNFNTKKIQNITSTKAQDIIPMWKDDNIYFISDRDRIMNLFCYNVKTGITRKLTDFNDYDIKFPSLGDNSIIFEKGGYIYNFDISTETVNKISITIADDFNYGRPVLKDASENIGSYSLSPDGKRITLGARGDVFSIPVKTGITRNLSKTSGVHERNVAWSPNGQYIAYISDKSGEDEIYIINQDGSGDEIQLTSNADTYKYDIVWSPDSKNILWADKELRLQYVEVKSKKVTIVDKAEDWEFSEYKWSPDSRWITYTYPFNSTPSRIKIYDVINKKSTFVTSEWYDCNSPVFSSNGKYLFFVSNRDFNPIYSWTEWNHAYIDMAKIYFITLEKSTVNPLKPVDDEVTISNSDENLKNKDEKPKNDIKEQKIIKVNIDFDGIIERIVALPVSPGRYYNINVVDNNVYYGYISKESSKNGLYMYDLDKQKEIRLGNYNNYEISFDMKKMLILNNNKYAVIDLPKNEISLKNEDYADLSNMQVMVNLREEWQQIFTESWRQMKYFFYDPNMHGVNWSKMKEKYQVLLPYVNSRFDLTYIIGEMIGELNVGHAYVGGGDVPKPKRIQLGLLGAKLSRDASGFYKIDKILKGENWTKDTRSPLSEVGVDVKEGEYIIAVNGQAVNNTDDIYKLLVNTSGKQVELTVNSKPELKGSRKTIVIPLADESHLYYYNWVQENIRKVNEATNGKVGYIHIPDMGVQGLNEFAKYFYPQLSKRALIIDDRGNGGGNVSPMIIERLNREMVLMKMSRNTRPSGGQLAMVYGPKVCLIDAYSASDGDLFPYQFKQMKIGKLIGVRTWGGVVGIRGSLPFIDGGSLSKPEFSHYAVDGTNWIIEGYGIDPDIYIDNDPAKEYAGEDEQLNKAIEVIMEEMKNYPSNLPDIPPFPDKSK